ncbi:TraB/GumN family protein [Alkalibacillus haloalkaliphilus]|uniref:TraB/GumN family protein n=1 Tax=Alkalibacillus haloalkaliphilus TaxID=94136 RepID=UPI002935DD93|nr:TraB/GumN family protein [Alkalibacillus haloalkaliphilus]MDV2581520.1 TraB/GumN family protein [Alkalibacillus haloalkaliphilus]
MKTNKVYILFILLALLLGACSDDTITFNDENLENAVLDELRINEELTESGVETVTSLDLSGENIDSLSGIEALYNLEVLDVSNNNIEDVSVLLDLNSLEEVTIAANPVIEDREQSELLDELSEQGTVVIESKQLGDPDGPGGFLWQVENEETTVYLLGTIHAGTRDFYPLHESIETAYYEADVIVPEIDLNDLNMYEMQQIQQELGMYEEGETIEDHVSNEMYEQLDETISDLGMSIEMVESYKPWLLSSLIQSLRLQQLGYLHGVDEYFLNQAAIDGKEVEALETFESQFEVLASPSEEYQMTMLEQSLVSLDQFDEEITTMFELYKSGDADELIGYLFDEDATVTEEEEAYMEELNDNRNYNMAEQIDEYLTTNDGKTYFVIVGAAHLIIEPHIVSILEEEGYSVDHIH